MPTPLKDYLATANVWEVLDLIVAEFTSDPTSVACFDARLVARAIALNLEHQNRLPDWVMWSSSLDQRSTWPEHMTHLDEAIRRGQCQPTAEELRWIRTFSRVMGFEVPAFATKLTSERRRP
jgi:hypothetical protein